jgi:hypothetical protein
MFGIDGKFVAEFSLNEKPDFIDQDDLFDFTIIEQAGNIPPIFSIFFQTLDDEIPQYINEGNELKVTLGRSLNELEKYSLIFQNSEHTKSGDRHLITATGCINSLSYFDTKVFITDKINGATALEVVGNKHFIVDNQLDKSSTDIMYHKQYNISHKRFVNDIWLSTFIPDSFPVVGITSEGKMLLRDMKKLVSTNKWDTFNQDDKDKFLIISPDYKIISRKGFFNTYTGVGREKFLYNQDDAIGVLQSEDVKSFIALTNKISVNADREKKSFENGVINENVHQNYWRSYLRNITSLANYSSIQLNFNFQNFFKPIHIYDVVYHKEISTDSKKASEFATGNYVTTKVVKRLQQESYITLVEASRESFNQPKGNLK